MRISASGRDAVSAVQRIHSGKRLQECEDGKWRICDLVRRSRAAAERPVGIDLFMCHPATELVAHRRTVSRDWMRGFRTCCLALARDKILIWEGNGIDEGFHVRIPDCIFQAKSSGRLRSTPCPPFGGLTRLEDLCVIWNESRNGNRAQR